MSEDFKWKELLRDGDGRASASRFCLIAGMMVVSLSLVYSLVFYPDNVLGLASALTGLVSIGYGVGKWMDSSVDKVTAANTTTTVTTNNITTDGGNLVREEDVRVNRLVP